MNLKKKIIILAFLIIWIYASFAVSAKTLYVSSSGSDSANGTSASTPLATLSSAYKALSGDTDIILLDNVAFVNPPAHSGSLTIKGNAASVTLSLSNEISLAGQLKLDNLTLTSGTFYANGHQLEIGTNVTSTGALAVYGGKKSASLTGNTDIRLYGGQYSAVYGGGNGGAVNGNTNVVFGGNTKQSGELYIFGGSNNASVSGSANVTLEGNAVCTYLFGAGNSSNGTAAVTNVFVNGGTAMNIYGGSHGGSANAGAEYNVTMTGGKVEAIFGGNFNSNVAGNVFVNLLGGEVTRRVYTGCYNNATNYIFSYSYDTDYYVNGTTVLSIAPGPKLVTGSDGNRGIFSGSRTKSQHDAEQNTIIYLDGCYSTYSGKIGEKSGLYTSSFKSHHDYIVNAGKGGKVLGTKTAGKVYIAPDKGNYGAIGTNYYYNEEAAVSSSTTVSFAKAFNINSVSKALSDNGISVSADVTSVNVTNEKDIKLYAAAFDGTRFVCGTFKDVPSSNKDVKLNLNFVPVSGKNYVVKTMLLNDKLEPLTESASK